MGYNPLGPAGAATITGESLMLLCLSLQTKCVHQLGYNPLGLADAAAVTGEGGRNVFA
jgi:hypothetical protein